MKYFPPFRFDERDLTLWEGNLRIRLTHKATALLHCLLDHPGQWVDKAYILERLWPDTHVQPDNVKVLIRELRRGLRDDARNPSYIRSQPGKGYQFVAAVSNSFQGTRPEIPARTAWFVNRVAELGALTDELDAVAAGQSRVVVVTGAPGIGKSSLCEVFLSTSQALCGTRHAVGLCVERYTHVERFAPFVDALQRLARAHPERVHELLIEYAPAWRAFFPEWSTRRPARATGLTPVPDAEMVDQLARFLTHLGRDKPTVLLIEDLQWADPSTVMALSALAERHDAGRFLIVCTATGAILPGLCGHASSPGLKGARTFMVPPFSEAHLERYLNVRFGPNAVSELAPALHRLTAGNPQLLSAALARIIERGYLGRIDARWQILAPVEDVEAALPQSVADALEIRLAMIVDEDCRILQHAALVGDEFTAESITVAADCERPVAEACLARLAGDDHVEEIASEGRWQPSLRRFRFRYPLQAELLRRRASLLLRTRVAERLSMRGARAHRLPA